MRRERSKEKELPTERWDGPAPLWEGKEFAPDWNAGSDALVFAESVARRFRVRSHLVEGLLPCAVVPSRRTLRLWRPFGVDRVVSGCRAGPSGPGPSGLRGGFEDPR